MRIEARNFPRSGIFFQNTLANKLVQLLIGDLERLLSLVQVIMLHSLAHRLDNIFDPRLIKAVALSALNGLADSFLSGFMIGHY